MAESEALEIEEDAKKGGNKLILIAAAALLGVSIGAAGVFFMTAGSSDPEEAVEAEPQVVRSIYHRLEKPFVVTVFSDGKQRYLQVGVSIKTKQQDAVDAIEKHEPVIKSKLNNLFANQTLDGMQSAQGREALNQQATAAVQEVLNEKAEGLSIEQVLFTDFVMQ